MVQLIGIQLKLRLALEHDMVLIDLGIHRVDLPLAEGIIESVINRGGRYAKSRGRDPVNHQRYSQPSRLLIGGDIFQLRQLIQPADESVGPVIEFIGVRVFESVLILRPAHPIVDRNVLHRLHKQLYALNLAQLRTEAADDVGGAHLALLERLEVDRHSTTIRRCIGSVGTNKRRKAFHSLIIQNYLREFLLPFRHGL